MTLINFVKENRDELNSAVNGAVYRHDGNGGHRNDSPIQNRGTVWLSLRSGLGMTKGCITRGAGVRV